MISAIEAVDTKEPYIQLDGNVLYPKKLFTQEEAERAERIVAELNGLPIYSAQALLKKIDCYLFQSLVTL